MEYLISEYGGETKEVTCQCCNETFRTNINRTRCSKKCANAMKRKRYNDNSILRVKYDKEKMVHYKKNVFGFVSMNIY